MGNRRGGVFGFGSEFEDPLGILDSEEDGMDFIERLEDLFEEAAKTDKGKKFFDSMNKKLLMETGVTPEVARLLNPEITVNYGEAFDKEVVAHAKLKLEHDAIAHRLDKLMPAIANQSLVVVERFKEMEKEHQECHQDWDRERLDLERALRLERRETTLFRSTVKDLDLRLKGFIADFESADEIPNEEVLEFMESLRDTVQDTYDEYRYVSDREMNPEVVRPKSRREKREEAMERLRESTASQAEASDDSAQASDGQTGGDKIPEGTFDANSAETSSEESQDQADAATV